MNEHHTSAEGRQAQPAFEAFEPESIPIELTALPQWVCWRGVRRKNGAKPTKEPINANSGKRARIAEASR